ncbi:response regulator transcription factor [Cryobacterium sp. PH31-AA6]|uniref:response regulator transcription factor n=1 Tax=Cryobacterium sp. PH31-AA6 TaxID=3046205 RepID=UPI0024BA0F7D|nr:response regulator transcription factor [Cryobacterium sp. PH31-AA6]MDJ0322668.1 response regulator transcription factor [Cryobacterium sp. PH31-AA6]
MVVEDDPSISQLVASYLEREGFLVDVAGDGETAVELTRSWRPDVVVLDLMLPGMDGIEVCRQIRTFSDAYVVMLTARIEEIDRLIGLSVGADDYIGKPFSPRELVARIRAMLRRPHAADPGIEPIRRFGALQIDPVAREVLLDGELVELTRTEFDLLEGLSAHPRRVFARRLLLEDVWGGDWFGDDHVVEVHVANLRRKLGDDPQAPRYIRTIRGVGYRMGAG